MESINKEKIIEIKEEKIDIHQIIRVYGKNKLGSIGELSKKTGISFKEAKNIMDNAYEELGDQVNISFKDRLKNQMSNINQSTQEAKEQKKEEDRELKEKLAQYDKDGIPYCPKCYSTSLSANKKGFGIGKAVVGGVLTGGIGLVAGNINAKKVRITCLKCGYQFWAGKK